MLKRKKILIVDDEAKFVEVLKEALEQKEEYQVFTALDGEEGLVKAMVEKPDLILLDIVMPGKDGKEVLQILKENKDTKLIPVIMITAQGATSSIFESEDLKAADYLIKPFEFEDLIYLIKRFLP